MSDSDSLNKNDSEAFLKLEHDLVSANVNVAKLAILDMMKEQNKKIVIDMGKVQQIDPYGVSLLVAASNSIRRSGKILKLINVPLSLMEIFDFFRMNKHFAIEFQNA
ncbi:MAG: STAS domain-containing protein [Candidatus Riflebacteria bacterium]|nr:STAS domain-containing protein [Candidatus Riflebacteria bacterium]